MDRHADPTAPGASQLGEGATAMTRRIGTVGMGVVMVFLFALVGQSPASAAGDTPSGCRVDHTPGVVSHWEFHHVAHGMTRPRVACLFGTNGRVLRGFWGRDRRWHEIVTYRNTVGTAVEVQYVDRGSTGHNFHATRTFWYPKGTS